jgi:chromosome segregation ATPase
MRRQGLAEIRSAIEANTERLTLDELARQGKTHVRVISGERVMELLRAVVDDVVAREALTLASKDRERIIAETKTQFDRVARIQAESERLLSEQKAMVAVYKERVAELEAREKGLLEKLEAERKAQAALAKEVADARAREKQVTVENAKLESRLETARETIENYDGEIERLSAQVREDAKLLEEARARLAAKEADLARYGELVATLQAQLGEARRAEGESAAVSALRGELQQMRSYLQALDEKSARAGEARMEELIRQLAARENISTKELEAKFAATMDKTLDEIAKTLKAATAKPIDQVVEATDVVVAKLFDEGAQLESNLDTLEVEVTTTKKGIAGNLERLRALKGGR